ncbi:unnamed protein product [Acanthosepion pharaonis]|uniref:Uncharacterized protein n=1 Tax=Acanthosepion pharaonis TaxID=158019 RepID=A0A812BB27_ACAPH|nr:unnamed protein product [Sepia pharaonis]
MLVSQVEIFLSIVNEEISRCRRWSHNRSIAASSYLGVIGRSYLGIICCCPSGASAVGEAISQCCRLSNMLFSSVEPYLGVVAGAISHYCRCPLHIYVVPLETYISVICEAISQCRRWSQFSVPSLEPYLGAIGSSYSGVVGSPYLDGAFGAIYCFISLKAVDPSFFGFSGSITRRYSHMSLSSVESYLGVLSGTMSLRSYILALLVETYLLEPYIGVVSCSIPTSRRWSHFCVTYL